MHRTGRSSTVIHRIDRASCERIRIGTRQRTIRENIKPFLPERTVRVRQPVRYSARIGIFSQRFAHYIHPVPHTRRRIRIEERKVRQTHIAQPRLVTQTVLIRLIVADLFRGIHLRIVPPGEIKVLTQVVGQKRRNGKPLNRVHPHRIAGEPGPPPHSLHREIAAIRVLVFGIIYIPPLAVKPILRRSLRLKSIP